MLLFFHIFAASSMASLLGQTLFLDQIPDAARGFSIELDLPRANAPSAWTFGTFETIDFDADGHTDLLLSTPFYADSSGRAGIVVVIFGPFGTDNIRFSQLNTEIGYPALRFIGNTNWAERCCNPIHLGQGRNIGDFNGDGIDDFSMTTLLSVFIVY